MSKKFKTGNLVIRSDHWRREHFAPDDYQLGIVTEVEFFDEDGKVVCYPAIHWEGEVIARSTHSDNADVTTWQDYPGRRTKQRRH
jgi:hypothetical protein